MKILVGSQNNVKIDAVKETISDYESLSSTEVLGIEVDSGVSEQPKSLNETVQGAINRAKNAFQGCEYSIGIEDGLMRVANTKTGHMNVCVCAIYDGQDYYIGLSSAFEYPPKVIDIVFKDNLDINQAFYKTGLTKNPKIGSAEGAISILTKGKLTRKENIKQAITMALIHILKHYD